MGELAEEPWDDPSSSATMRKCQEAQSAFFTRHCIEELSGDSPVQRYLQTSKSKRLSQMSPILYSLRQSPLEKRKNLKIFKTSEFLKTTITL